MSLAAYQEVLCRMVASAAYRERFLAQPDEFPGLTPLELHRLRAVAAQPGMRVNTAIHRANRMAPLHQTLPFTCFLLGEQLRQTLDRFWGLYPSESLQLDTECGRFTDFLMEELNTGRVAGAYVEEVLLFERACAELRLRKPPLLRVVRFRHAPEPLLAALAQLELPDPAPEPGDYHLAIDCRQGDADFYVLSDQAAAAILAPAAN